MVKSLLFCFLLTLAFITVEAASPTMVLYLPMNEGQGDTAADLSGNGNSGALEDGPNWVQGKFGQALEFNEGSRIHILASDSLHGDIFKDDFTLAAWVKPNMTGDTWQHVWRSVDENDATQCSMFLNTTGFFSWRGRVAEAWGERVGTPEGTVNANEWVHMTLVSDKINYTIYLNGVEAASTPFEEMDGGITDYYMGFDGRQWNERFSGAIDEVYFFNAATSADKIGDIMAGAVTSVQPVSKIALTWGSIKRY